MYSKTHIAISGLLVKNLSLLHTFEPECLLKEKLCLHVRAVPPQSNPVSNPYLIENFTISASASSIPNNNTSPLVPPMSIPVISSKLQL